MGEPTIVVMGEGGVGKSALTLRFIQGIFPTTYDPTIEDSYRKLVDVPDVGPRMFSVMDTAGTESFTSMRSMYIKHGKGFLLVYSATSLGSFHGLTEMYDQIVQVKDTSDVPIVLVCNKADLHDQRTVSSDAGESLARRWGVPYLETSALKCDQVDEAFLAVIDQILQAEDPAGKGKKKKKKSPGKNKESCIIL